MKNAVDHIRAWHDEYSKVRRDLHAHPELGFEEHRTARVVCDQLTALGIEHHSGIGRTGIVAVVPGRKSTSGRSIGLRADMDALPLQEENAFAHKSRYDGRMHACGHDGHTTMLLAAARYLHETRNFDGIAYLIFQPGEEGYAGAKAMIEDGLFERFPAERVYALHNWPGLPPGRSASRRVPRWRRPIRSKSRSTAAAATARIRTRRSTRCWWPAILSSRRSRS
jgi:hippurate hydrolase